MSYATVGLTRVAEEQGEWAAASAVAILNGLSPSDIPLMTNRRWDKWVNEPFVERLGLTLERSFLRQAKRACAEPARAGETNARPCACRRYRAERRDR